MSFQCRFGPALKWKPYFVYLTTPLEIRWANNPFLNVQTQQKLLMAFLICFYINFAVPGIFCFRIAALKIMHTFLTATGVLKSDSTYWFNGRHTYACSSFVPIHLLNRTAHLCNWPPHPQNRYTKKPRQPPSPTEQIY